MIMTDQQKYIDELESAIATLDLENQLMRARNERLEKEVEHLRDVLTMKANTQSSWLCPQLGTLWFKPIVLYFNGLDQNRHTWHTFFETRFQLLIFDFSF